MKNLKSISFLFIIGLFITIGCTKEEFVPIEQDVPTPYDIDDSATMGPAYNLSPANFKRFEDERRSAIVPIKLEKETTTINEIENPRATPYSLERPRNNDWKYDIRYSPNEF